MIDGGGRVGKREGHQGLASVPVKTMKITDSGGACARRRCAGTGLSRL